MLLLFLSVNSMAFWNKDGVYIPWLNFQTISKYNFLLFEAIVDMVKLIIHQIECFQNFDVEKFEYRKKKTAKEYYYVIVWLLLLKLVCPKSLKNSSTDQIDVAIKAVKIDGMSMSHTLKIHRKSHLKHQN